LSLVVLFSTSSRVTWRNIVNALVVKKVLFFSVMGAPPPVEITVFFSSVSDQRSWDSYSLNFFSPSLLNISGIGFPVVSSIKASRSTNLYPIRVARSLPTVDFPLPIKPIRAIRLGGCLAFFVRSVIVFL